MKPISANLKAHLEGDTLTVCTLWKITRTDAQVFGFTDNSRDVLYSGTLYEARSGHTPSNVRTTSTLGVDNLDVQTVLDSQAITEDDIRAGLWDFAEVEIMLVNYLALSDGHMTLRRGWIGNVQTGTTSFIAELRGMMQPLQQVIGRVYAPACDAQFGDARCSISAALHTVTGSVSSVSSTHVFTDTGRTETDGHFAGGLITWTSGNNAGYRMEVKTSTAPGVITLQQPMPNPLTVADAYSLVAGCDKKLSTCRDRFANAINFRGFPHVPGIDKMVTGA